MTTPYPLDQTQAYNQQLRGFLPGAVHSNFRSFSREEPIRFASGAGSRLCDLDGNVYLDLSCQYGAMILGHGHARFNDALKSQIDRLLNANSAGLEIEVAEKLRGWMPSLEQVRFGMSGSEVVSNAVRLARAYTRRSKIVRFEGHFHGSADELMGGTVGDLLNPQPVPFKGDPYDTGGRSFETVQRDSFLLPWNRIDVVEEVFGQYGNEIAAVLTEPIAINGGGIEPDPGYLQRLRELCDQHGIVLIFDEMITGFRVGVGGAQEALGVRPDLTTLGKAMSNGIPISAFGGRKEIMDLLAEQKVVHGGTYNGHPLGLAAIRATIDALTEDGGAAYGRMRETLGRIKAIFQAQSEAREVPLHFRGTDTIGVFHGRAEPGGFRDYFNAETQTITTFLARTLARYGVLVCPVSRIYLNLAIGEEDLAFLEERVAAAWDEALPMLAKLRPRKRKAPETAVVP